jgi:4-hydroxy-4-methyl-2-oxoglutarate aldolase
LPTTPLPTATLHEAYGKRGALPSAIKPVAPGMRLWGPAVPVACPPGDNLRIHHAIYHAQPGDVLVVDCGGAYEHGYWGEILNVAAQARGLAGLVIDACVRDGDALAALGLPVFARGRCIRGTGKNPYAAGSINTPIRIGEVFIRPGDMIAGDGDGLVVIEREHLAEVLTAAQAREDAEAGQLAELRQGRSTVDLLQLPSLAKGR